MFLSFLGCSKRVKIIKSDIPVSMSSVVDTQDIQVKTIDPSDVLEPAVKITKSVSIVLDTQDIQVQTIVSTDVLEPVPPEPMTLPGQPLVSLIDTIQQKVTIELIAFILNNIEAPVEAPVELEPNALAPAYEALGQQNMARMMAQPVLPFYRALKPAQSEVIEVQKKSKGTRMPRNIYNHPYWPSPRAANFVRYLKRKYCCGIPDERLMYEGRLTHEKALIILASYGSMTVDELLKMNPVQYLKTKMNSDWPTVDINMLPLGWQT